MTSEQFEDSQNFYITSIGRYYPGKAKITGDNLPVQVCADLFLKRELEIIEPQIYILVGIYAAKYFFGDEPLEELVFHNHICKGKPLYVLPHLSSLNRKWLKDYLSFEKERIIEIRKVIQKFVK